MRPKGILIAYQDDSWVRPLSKLLTDRGYRIEATRVVSEILRKVRGRDIHVVLLDDKMEEIKAALRKAETLSQVKSLL